jgi:Zn-finger nucleic acid-binding protein
VKCPYCSTTMRGVKYEGMPIWTCPGCYGEFLDGKRLKYIERKNEVRFTSSERNILKYGKSGPEEEKQLTCPRCERSMTKGRYRATGVIIDHCKSCDGVWLDDKELEKVQALGEAGKTERRDATDNRIGLIEAVMGARTTLRNQQRK